PDGYRRPFGRHRKDERKAQPASDGAGRGQGEASGSVYQAKYRKTQRPVCPGEEIPDGGGLRRPEKRGSRDREAGRGDPAGPPGDRRRALRIRIQGKGTGGGNRRLS